MRSGTSTFELPNQVTNFHEIQHCWVYNAGYKSAIHFCPYRLTLTPTLHTSQTGLILKFLKNSLVCTKQIVTKYTHLFLRSAASTRNICLGGLHSTKYKDKNYFAQLTHLKTIQS